MVTKRKLIYCLVVVFIACSVQAEVLVYEPFDYSNAGESFIGAEGGAGLTSGWEAGGSIQTRMHDGDDPCDVMGTITPPDGAYESGKTGRYGRIWGQGGSGAIIRSLDFTIDFDPNTQTTYYFSVLFRRVDDSDGGGTEMIRFFDFRNSEYYPEPLMIAGGSSDEEGWALLGAYGSQAYTSGAIYQLTPDETDIHNYLVIAKLVVRDNGDDVLSMKFYESGVDTVPSTEPTSWDVTYSNSVTGTSVQHAMAAQDFAGALDFDEVRIGTTYDDVIKFPADLSFCSHISEFDFNEDCVVDFADFAVFAEEWLTCNQNNPDDC